MAKPNNRIRVTSALDLLDRVLLSIEKVLLNITVVALIGVMLLVASDALGRYFFNKPIVITIFFVSHYVLPLLMLLPASYVLRRAKHISVDLFASMMPVRLNQGLIGLALLLVLPILWIMAYRVGHAGYESFRDGKVAYGLIAWPFWVEQAIYCVCFAMLTARTLQVALANIVSALGGDETTAISLLNKHDSPMEEVD